MKKDRIFAVLVVSSFLSLSNAMAVPLLAPGDPILAIDTGPQSESPGNGNENAINVLDGDVNTKYLNFGEDNSGFIVTPAGGASVVKSFLLATANDSEERDPATYELYGTNDAILTEEHGRGNLENWTLISAGSVTLPAARLTYGTAVDLAGNTESYTSYRLTFTVKDEAVANSMQVAEVGFYDAVAAGGNALLSLSDTIIPIDLDSSEGNSSYPAGEAPGFAIDGTLAKYLNFGKEGAGFIVTPSAGASMVQSFTITTANDADARDPSSYSLFGTNEAILSADNSNGTGENWTLISQGGLSLPLARDTVGDTVFVSNTQSYTSYKMIFETVRSITGNSMQIAEIQFDGLLGTPAELKITEFDYDRVLEEFDLTWESESGTTYDIAYSTDLTVWTTGWLTPVTASGPETSVSGVEAPIAAAGELYFRVEVATAVP